MLFLDPPAMFSMYQQIRARGGVKGVSAADLEDMILTTLRGFRGQDYDAMFRRMNSKGP